MSNGTMPRVTPQLLLGVFVIAVGVLFTLDNLGILQSWEYVRFWPVALIAIGLLKLWQVRDRTTGPLGGLVFTIAGLWLLLEQTTVVRISFRDMWPLVLVLFGTYLVWQGAAGRGGRTVSGDAQSSMNAIALLGGVEHSNSSRDFRGGNLTAIMGGCEIDLRQAAIEGDAFLDVFALWGGIEVRVPEDWIVDSRVLPVLGGSVNKTRGAPGAAHRLIVRGFAIMGGVEIKN